MTFGGKNNNTSFEKSKKAFFENPSATNTTQYMAPMSKQKNPSHCAPALTLCTHNRAPVITM